MKTCACDQTLNNTGTPECNPLMDTAEMLIVVPKYDSNGDLNFIDLTDTLDEAYFTAKINADSKKDRWYPLPRIKNAVSTKAESVFKTWDDGSKELIREGLRSWVAVIPNQSPTFLGKIKGFRCAEFGVYIVDKAGNLIGSLDAAGELYPIAVESASWNPVFVFTTPTDVQQIALNFDFDLTAADEDLQMILGTSISPVKLLNLKGLIDVTGVFSSLSSTGVVLKMTTEYGDALNPGTVIELTSADFVSSSDGTTSKVRRTNNTAANVTVSSAESPASTYTLAWTAQTTGDHIVVKPKANGFDFSTIEAQVQVIP